ncbi:MAG: hypothetical protein QXP58_06940 [Thermoprotei archaeon]
MSTTVSNPAEIPTGTVPLSSDEQAVFDRIFSRTFVFENIQRPFNQILLNHKDEIQTAAEIAKAQFQLNFGGLTPTSTEFGMYLLRAPFVGLRTWYLDNTGYTGGGPNVLIDGNQAAQGVNTWLSKALLTGNPSDSVNPLIVGKYAVHAIIALGDYSANPVIDSFQQNLNGTLESVYVVEPVFVNTNLRLFELDSAIVYKNQTQFIWYYYAKRSSTNEAPYFFGVTFLPFTQSKFLDANLFNGGTSVESVVHY